MPPEQGEVDVPADDPVKQPTVAVVVDEGGAHVMSGQSDSNSSYDGGRAFGSRASSVGDHSSAEPTPVRDALPRKPTTAGQPTKVPWSQIPAEEQVVISGISARLPESANVEEFAEHLYNKEDMITEDDRRWRPGIYNTPKRLGKLKEVAKFDAKYFGVTPKQADHMDPQVRILLETVHEALVDAGMNPLQLRGSRTGVYVGASYSETDAAVVGGDPESIHGYTMIGCQRSMFANRVSYAFDFQGPSFALDTACSSTMYALNVALDAIRLDHCDRAVVAGTMLHLLPANCIPFLRLNMMSPDGKCKSFDAKANGYAKGECIGAVILQKRHEAKRVYCTVVHAKSNTDGYKSSGITVPSGDVQAKLLRQVYTEAGVDPAEVDYFETHGTGTIIGDPQECHGIQEVICADRDHVLHIGSVKSNMGHAETASGIASLAKVIVAMERGAIPPNLHYEEPNPYIPGLADGSLEVITETLPWNGGYVAINSFGFGGANTHIILKSNDQPSLETSSEVIMSLEKVPKMICYSAPTQLAVEKMFDKVEQLSDDNDFHALVCQQAASGNVNPNAYRGYLVLKPDLTEKTTRVIQKLDQSTDRPIWYVYTGMGCQWAGMAKHLSQNLPSFRHALKQCSEVVQPLGVYLFDLIMNGGEDVYANTLHCMLSNCAIQVALTDVLKQIGVEPDGIIGHSTGEILCGYADGCLTKSQTMLCAYYRGKAVLDASMQKGAMAAVGLTWEEAEKQCPAGVVPACHNAVDSVTVSGYADKVEAFVEKLKADGVFAKMVNSAGVAFHSPLMKAAEKQMLSNIRKVISKGTRRSSKWMSTSVSPSEEELAFGNFCSAEYQVNNAMSPVLFQQAVEKIPSDAICVEIAPHSLLQSILRRGTTSTVTNIGLLKAKVEDETAHLYDSLGKLYLNGADVQVEKLFYQNEYPVKQGTPMLGPLLDWNHDQSWSVVTMKNTSSLRTACEFIFEPMNPQSEDYYLLDHVIDGRPLFPFTGHLVLAWRALCKLRHVDWDPVCPPPIIIEKWEVLRPTIISKYMKFKIVTATNNSFVEIYENEELASHGYIHFCETRTEKPFILDEQMPAMQEKIRSETDGQQLKCQDIYKITQMRGYDYGPKFQGIASLNLDSETGVFYWNDNWVTFLDTFLQVSIIRNKSKNLSMMPLPSQLQRIRIDPESHRNSIIELEDGKRGVQLVYEDETRILMCGGVELLGAKGMSVQRRMAQNGKLYLDHMLFVAHEDDAAFDDEQFTGTRDSLEDYEQIIGVALSRLWSAWKPELKDDMKELLSHSFESVQNNYSEASRPVTFKDKAKTTLSRFIDNAQKCESIEELKVIGNDYVKQLNSDLLYGACCHPRVLDVLIAMVQENLPGIKIKMCFVDPSDLFMPRSVLSSVLRCPRYKVEASAMSSKSSFLNTLFKENDWEELNIELFQSKFTEEDLPVEHAESNNLIILDRVLSKVDNREDYLRHLSKLLTKDGFALVVEYNQQSALVKATAGLIDLSVGGKIRNSSLEHHQWLSLFDEAGFHVVAYQTDSSIWTTNYLIRRKYEARSAKFLNVEDMAECSFLKQLQAEVMKVYDDNAPYNIWLKSEMVCDNGLLGMAMCLKDELPKEELRIRVLADLSVKEKAGGFQKQNEEEMAKIFQHDLLFNVYRDGKWGSLQSIQIDSGEVYAYRTSDTAYLNSTVRGDLSSLRWIDNPDYQDTQLLKRHSETNSERARTSDAQVCYVHYVGLNFRDVMLASGRLAPDVYEDMVPNPDTLLGTEFSGILDDGRRVAGILPAQSFATKTLVNDVNFFEIPDNMSLEDACTLPVCFMTAYLALVCRGNIRQNQSILIHSGSGGVGQAAIRLASMFNADIFITVSTEAKRKLLQTKFPFLQDDHFASSRTTDFEQMIMRVTKGKGVDMVLNSLAEEKLQASVRCLAKHGKFLEIGKYDLMKNSALGMECFMKDVAFHGILLDLIFCTPLLDGIHRASKEALADGTVEALDRTLFTVDKVEDAFRFMASGKHTGKILIKVRDEPPISPYSRLTPIENIAKLKVNAITRFKPKADLVYLITGGLGGFGFELARWLVERGARKIVLSSRRGVRSGYQANYLKQFEKAGVTIQLCHEDITSQVGTQRAVKFCLQLGPLGGVFHLAMVLRDTLLENQTVDNFKESAAAKYWGTRHLDAATRQYCSDQLTSFVCFSSQTAARGNSGQTAYGWANSAMERVMEQRRADGLAGQAIQWGAIGDVGVIIDNNGDNNTLVAGLVPQRLPSCFQCLDMLLINNYPLCGVYVKHEADQSVSTHKIDVLSTIANIVGVHDVATMDLDAKLSDLGIDSLMGMEIVQMLERNYDLVLSMKDVRNLTLKDIRDRTSGNKKKDGGGAKSADKGAAHKPQKPAVFNFNIRVRREDITADMYKMLLPMNEKTESATNRTVYFTHPIEGVSVPLKQLVDKLENPVLCLQCTPETPQDTIENMATAYLQEITKHRGGKLRSGDFHLVGYSYGAVVAFEMACQLSQLGVAPASVTLIDSSPYYWTLMNQRYKDIGGLAENNTLDDLTDLWPYLQTELLWPMSTHYGVTDETVKKQLMTCATTADRMRTLGSHLVNVDNAFFDDVDFAAFVCETLWNKYLMADRYSTSARKYTGAVHLIRAEQPLSADLPDDYGLSQTVDGPVHVSRVAGEHDSLVMGDSVPVVAERLTNIFATNHS